MGRHIVFHVHGDPGSCRVWCDPKDSRASSQTHLTSRISTSIHLNWFKEHNHTSPIQCMTSPDHANKFLGPKSRLHPSHKRSPAHCQNDGHSEILALCILIAVWPPSRPGNTTTVFTSSCIHFLGPLPVIEVEYLPCRRWKTIMCRSWPRRFLWRLETRKI